MHSLSPGGDALGVIVLAGVFIGLTCWWLTQDRSIPVYDAGDHLWTVIHFRRLVDSGDLLGPFNYTSQYPPLAYLVGVLATYVGGVSLASPIIGENLVFVSLLTLGCYQTGKLLFNERAGLLAAVFALGSPLLIAQFHVFMLDAPETGVVAVSIWLILASRRFSSLSMSGLAGLAVAAGLLVKVQFPFFVAGIVLCSLLRGGWRNWRGLMIFVGVVVAIGSPWYIRHLSELHEIARLAGTNSGAVAESLPPTLSMHNLTWYLWSILNYQLLLPLFLLTVAGAAWMAVTLARGRGDRLGERVEFAVGAIVAWLAISITPHHDLRYGMPLLPYLAIIATGWIVSARRAVGWIATGVLALGVGLNTVGTTFGAGSDVALGIGDGVSSTYVLPTEVALYTSRGFLVSGPSRDGDFPALLAALRRNGVSTVGSALEQSEGPDFSWEGLEALTLIANLNYVLTRDVEFSPLSSRAFLVHSTPLAGKPPPCVDLSNGTGVFVVRARPGSGYSLYCPFRRPAYYAHVRGSAGRL